MEITINGKQYPVIFNMSTLMTYEGVTGRSIFGEKFVRVAEQVPLVFSAVLSADPKTSLTLEDLFNCDNYNDFVNAANSVLKMLKDFFKIPEVVKKDDENKSQENQEESKND